MVIPKIWKRSTRLYPNTSPQRPKISPIPLRTLRSPRRKGKGINSPTKALALYHGLHKNKLIAKNTTEKEHEHDVDQDDGTGLDDRDDERNVESMDDDDYQDEKEEDKGEEDSETGARNIDVITSLISDTFKTPEEKFQRLLSIYRGLLHAEMHFTVK